MTGTGAPGHWLLQVEAQHAALPERLRPLLIALFHRLGCSPVAFHQHVMPLVARWRLHAGHIAGVAEHAQPFAFECLLLQAVQGSAGCPAASARQRLRQAHLAVMDLVWQRAQGLRLEDAAGACWPGPELPLAIWCARAPGPYRLCGADSSPLAAAVGPGGDPWQAAAASLVQRGIWGVGQPCGRWWLGPAGWCLLWPLGGRDLLGTAPIQSLRLPAEGEGLPALVHALGHWGHLRGTEWRVTGCRRPDGRQVQALPVARPLFGVGVH